MFIDSRHSSSDCSVNVVSGISTTDLSDGSTEICLLGFGVLVALPCRGNFVIPHRILLFDKLFLPGFPE